jgi:hypothetical protein
LFVPAAVAFVALNTPAAAVPNGAYVKTLPEIDASKILLAKVYSLPTTSKAVPFHILSSKSPVS